MKIVGVYDLMQDAEDGDADGAAELLEEAVKGSGGGSLIAGHGVEEGGGNGGDQEADTDSADDHGQDDEPHGGADVDPGEQVHGDGQKEDAQYRDIADMALIGLPASVRPGDEHHQGIGEHQ